MVVIKIVGDRAIGVARSAISASILILMQDQLCLRYVAWRRLQNRASSPNRNAL